jgi:hypothetical protein
MVRAGRTIGLVECNVFDQKEGLVARASSTCMTLRGQLADGRALPTEFIQKPRSEQSRCGILSRRNLMKSFAYEKGDREWRR